MRFRLVVTLTVCLFCTAALAGPITLDDPSGDDFGPGSYTYPTDSIYLRGSFDLRQITVRRAGSTIEFKVKLAQRIEDPWDSRGWPEKGNGFSLQMIQIYLDLDDKEGQGHLDALPGINATFASVDAWDKVIIISPQAGSRVRREVQSKAASMAKDVVVPKSIKVSGRVLVVKVKRKYLPGLDLQKLKLQVVVQSNEGYAAKDHVLSRRVNEYPGQHRFGGGSDYDCDPHAIDILTLSAEGKPEEKEAQKKALAYTCGPEGKSVKRAVLPMVRRP
jgi:carbohydrate-binding DOMON domain-containing protein